MSKSVGMVYQITIIIVFLDEMIIMPDHVHGIIQIDNKSVGVGFKPTPTVTRSNNHGLSEIMRVFKTFSSRRINLITDDRFQWQRSFHD